MKRVFLDTNVLLEILFRRKRYDTLREQLSSLGNVQFCVSALSVDIVMYFVESEKQSKAIAWKFLSKYEILAINQQDTEWAYDNDQGDYEDALQISCARRRQCLKVITLDQKMDRMYGKYIAVQTVR